MPTAKPRRSPLATLLSLLTLDPLDRDLFLASTPRGEGRLFGGLVAAQSTLAAGATVPHERQLHSLHAYFLRPGQHGVPIRLLVDRIRDGRSFTTRRVVAHQAGEAIFNLDASFCVPEAGVAHQDPMPDAPAPEGLPDWEELRSEMLHDTRAKRRQAVEVRVCDPDDPSGAQQPPHKRVWLRPIGPLPEDRRIHEAFYVYASDRTLLSTASRPHGLPWGRRSVASLDHAVWLHRPARFEGWILYASHSPVAFAARGLVLGAMYDTRGARVASVAQEGLVRVPR
ncbi:MAG: thioesterase family protein [Chloroflexi bacterium]|nr:thioesterase family protein [Chloroflexota bacterium]